MRVWFDGKIGDGRINLDPADRGLTLGDGLFETILVLNGVALWSKEHLQRFEDAARELGIVYPADEIARAVLELCAISREAHVLRLTLTRGSGARGLAADTGHSTLIGTLVPFDTKLMFGVVRPEVVRVARNELSPASRLKTLSYIDQVLAAREAQAMGYDEAIMLNSKGHLACSSIGNIFLVNGKTLITPSLNQGVLPGIVRGVILRGAGALGYKVEERAVPLWELGEADGAFVTNSLRLLRPIPGYQQTKFDGLAQLICDMIKQQCGLDPRSL
jgi:branched-chain amino acid aminotransferase